MQIDLNNKVMTSACGRVHWPALCWPSEQTISRNKALSFTAKIFVLYTSQDMQTDGSSCSTMHIDREVLRSVCGPHNQTAAHCHTLLSPSDEASTSPL